MSKVSHAGTAARLIRDDSCLWLVAGGGGINEPGFFLKAVEKRFLETGHPQGLTLCHSAGVGDKRGGGVDCFAHEGMVRKVIGSHWTWSVRMQELAMLEKIEAYVLPQGAMTQLSREIAGGRPGLITKTGLGTFVDPRVEGGRMNKRSRDELSDVVTLLGQEYLLYTGGAANRNSMPGPPRPYRMFVLPGYLTQAASFPPPPPVSPGRGRTCATALAFPPANLPRPIHTRRAGISAPSSA